MSNPTSTTTYDVYTRDISTFGSMNDDDEFKLSRQLAREYGSGFNEKSLRRMMQLAELFPEPRIIGILSQNLSWSHFVEIIPIEDRLKR